MPIIELKEVSKTYKTGEIETRALNCIELSVEDGEFTALVGPSGSGKTTLLQLMGCLDKPDSGEVWLEGQDVTRISQNSRADLRSGKIGFIFQFFALVPVLSAYENVELPLLLNNFKSKERKRRVMELLDAVGMTDRTHHRPDQLSGGEQQRVAIARALVHDPLLVLADEPTGNLDEETGRQVLILLDDLTRQVGKNLLLVTHSRANAVYADRILNLQDGQLIEEIDGRKGGL